MVKNPEKQAELSEHLAELRARLIRCIVYIAVGMIVAWMFYEPLKEFLMRPMDGVLERLHSQYLYTGWAEPFTVRLQVSLVGGIILVAPFVILEVWGFISPGLTANEKRPLKWIVPLSILLFASGVALCYWILPVGLNWFTLFVESNAKFTPKMQDSLIFLVKMLLVFGILFELPVFLMFLAKVGIVNSKFLRDNWRYAIVATSVVAAVATPSNDALTMLLMAIPLAGLYFLSILLVRFTEGKPRKSIE